MRFLCPDHRDHLATLSNSDLLSLWFEWMNQAAFYYERAEWDQAIAYSGCSLELSLVYISKVEGLLQINACNNLCLSCLYCMNTLLHNNQHHKANYLLAMTAKLLEHYKDIHNNAAEITQSIKALRSEPHQDSYFKSYLNFPFKKITSNKNPVLH